MRWTVATEPFASVPLKVGLLRLGQVEFIVLVQVLNRLLMLKVHLQNVMLALKPHRSARHRFALGAILSSDCASSGHPLSLSFLQVALRRVGLIRGHLASIFNHKDLP